LKQLIEFEGDGDGALKVIANLQSSERSKPGTSSRKHFPFPSTRALVSLEKDLVVQVADLRARRQMNYMTLGTSYTPSPLF
jgi:hypothetical protein